MLMIFDAINSSTYYKINSHAQHTANGVHTGTAYSYNNEDRTRFL